jgi:arylsulfatase A-like enzyme
MSDHRARTFSRHLSLLASVGLVVLLGGLLTWYKGHRTATPAVASQRRRPDVVVILTDDQFYNTLWSMPTVHAELVRKGVRFANMFASNPLCAPSRASILTGQYSHTTGVYDNAPSSFGSAQAFHDSGYESDTMATWFHGAGYRTGIIGKYVNGFTGRWIPPGWDESAIGAGYWGTTLYEDGVKHTYPKTTYETSLLGDKAVGFIHDAPSDQPLFLYLAPYAPHENAAPAQKYAHLPVDLRRGWPRPNFNEGNVSDKPSFIRRIPRLDASARWEVNWLRRRQYRALRSVDDMVGRVLSALKARGTLQNSIIVFMTDNGQMWGSHRLRGDAKRVPYDESLRLPLVVRWDGHDSAGTTSRRMVSNIDIAPTLAALARVRVPGPTDGVSFAPLLADPAGPPVRRRLLIEQAAGPKIQADRIYTPNYCGVRTTRYTFVHYADGQQELYDDRHDPYQLSNLAQDPRWKRRMEMLESRTRALCTPAPPGVRWR